MRVRASIVELTRYRVFADGFRDALEQRPRKYRIIRMQKRAREARPTKLAAGLEPTGLSILSSSLTIQRFRYVRCYKPGEKKILEFPQNANAG